MVFRQDRGNGNVAIYYADPNSECDLYRGSLIHVYSPDELSMMNHVTWEHDLGAYLAGNYLFDFPEEGSRYLWELKNGDTRAPVMARGRIHPGRA
jgi:hypothetical protein